MGKSEVHGDIWDQGQVCIGSYTLLMVTSGLQTHTELHAQGWFLLLAPQERVPMGGCPSVRLYMLL